MLSSLDEHQLLVLWVQLAALVTLARVLGGLLRRIGQPAVVGELSAGLLLGPSVFGKVWPSGFHWFLPRDDMQGSALVALGWVGAALLLVVTGFETDLGLIRRFGRAAALVAAGSLVLPFACGIAVGWILPATFMADHHSRTVFALFMATALSISSLPVIAKILSELQLMRRNFGQINLAAGMANDTVGWILLGLISGLASSGHVSLGRVAFAIVGMAGFLLLALTVGQRLVDAALRRIRSVHGDDEQGSGSSLGLAIVVMLACGAAAQALGLEAVLGAFIAGIVLGRSRFQREEVHGRIEAMTSAFFAPVFFATAGLRVDLGLLKDSTVLWWSLGILVVATLSKFLGSFIGAELAKLSRREAVALGAGLNARGAMEIVIATVGLGLGVLNQAAFTAIVLMAMVTSMLAPPTLRLAVRNWRGSDEEQARLDREATLGRNIVVKDRRMLLPSRGQVNSIVAAQILNFAWPIETPVTVLSVADNGVEPDIEAVLNVVADRAHEVQQTSGPDSVGAILAEAKLGYGVIGLGVNERPTPGKLLSSVADELVLRAALPLVIVRRARNLETSLPAAFTRAIVPVSGSRASRAAQEVAFHLSSQLGTEIVLTHVIDREQTSDEATAATSAGYRWVGRREGAGVLSRDDARVKAGERLLERATDFAAGFEVHPRATLRSGTSASDELLAAAEQHECDLLIVGATARELGDRPYLGHLVEDLLARADTTVVIVTDAPPSNAT
ncbi:MAG TPA: cation:proton antiporter [Acidimicrobiales bacterium]|jgi:Kef-type K+ transport system membrane component KefB/nucleotide-binding universal stress UspA family protein|nr:cation:proton antiporter [Acidimicrobiales bacterium]